jgi:hypothetical protein
MADPINPFDFATETLATFLAKTVGDGTYADVVESLKIDQVGEEAKATEIRIAAGQIYGNTIDDFVLAAYPLLRTVATGGGGGGGLTETPSPAFGGGPGAYTYSISGNERIAFADVGPPGTLTIPLPSIATLADGERISLRLPFGNPSSSVSIAPSPADSIADPSTGLPAPPGVPLVLPGASQPGGTVLTWQLVAAPVLIWKFEYTAPSGGGGGETYAQTLALGQDSGALGPYLNDPQRRVMGSDLASSPSPGVFTSALEGYQYEGSHVATLTAGSGEAAGTYVLDPVDILRNSNLTIGSGTAFLEWWAYRFASSDGIAFPVLRGYATAIETWTIGAATARVGAQRVPDVETFSGFECARLAVGSTLRSLAFEVLEAPAGGLDMTVRLFYKITYVQNAPGS